MKFRNLLFTLAAVLIFASCEKKDDKGLPKNSHRLIRAYVEREGYYYIDSLFYDGEKLTSIMKYYKNGNEPWELTGKTEITYDGSHVTVLESNLETSDWVPSEKFEFTIADGLMTEEIATEFYNGVWDPEWKWTYQYSGNNIKLWQSYEPDENGDFYLDGKCEYTYQNGKLTESMEYILNGETWSQYIKTTYLFDEEKIVNWTQNRKDLSDNWFQYYKSDLSYTGDLVSQIDEYGWDPGELDWQPSISLTFTYNSNDYLYEISSETAYSGATSYTAYEYEEGNGNAKFFYYYPEEMVSGEPMLKSANTKSNRNHVPYYKRILNLQ